LFPFEFVIAGPPLSLQTRNRQRYQAWKDAVRGAAAARWPATLAPTSESVKIRITYYYDRNSPDVDNIIKPIQDALNGLIYVDDRQVIETTSRRRRRDRSFRISVMSPVLAAGIEQDVEFLHVEVVLAGNAEEAGG